MDECRAEYNRKYERCMTEEIPESLARESANERNMMPRFRWGNEEKENWYWMEKEERRYRMCKEERETIEHFRWDILRLTDEDQHGSRSKTERLAAWMNDGLGELLACHTIAGSAHCLRTRENEI
ncbi:hypothetical protein MTP99_001043 [Tenebrio molitor]|nr:hypothetical protein MTP99_001043 [Tenebrio molitor]